MQANVADACEIEKIKKVAEATERFTTEKALIFGDRDKLNDPQSLLPFFCEPLRMGEKRGTLSWTVGLMQLGA